MNAYERYIATITGKPVDFVPRVPIVMQFAAEYSGSYYGAFASDYRVLVEANRRCAEDFGFDQLSAISDPYRETQGFGAEIEFVRDGVPKCVTPPLAASKNLALLKQPDPLVSERMVDRVQAIRAFHEQFQGVYSILGWIEGPAAEAADVRGVSQFMLDLMEDKPFCGALMDRCVEVGIAFAKAQIEAGADTIGIGDAIASQVSPRVYNTLIQPREKRLIQAIQDIGAFVRLHICGNITHLLPGITNLGIDLLDVDHMVDLATVRQAVGNQVVITGNLDPVSAVLNSAPDAIQQAVQRCRAAAGSPYMVNAGCEIPAGTPPENLKALCRLIPG